MRSTPRKTHNSFTYALALAIALASAAHALEISEWKYRQTLTIERAGIATIVLPPETLDAARMDLGDIRIVDPAGRELAYVLHRATRPSARPVPARSFEARLADGATQLTIGSAGPMAEVSLETPAPNFIKRALVEVSNNGSTWETAQDGVPLFRQSGAERLSIPVSATFVRITIDDSRSAPVPFTAAKVTPRLPLLASVATLNARISAREEFAGETVLTIDLGAAHVPLDAMEFSTPERLFTRQVSVGVRELRDDSAVERAVASGTIYNIAIEGDTHAEDRSVPLGLTPRSRELIVHIANGDSPPLAIEGVRVTRFEVMLYFDAASPGEYVLLSGHKQIAAPRYDVSAVRLGNASAASAIAPGTLSPNPNHRPVESLSGAPLVGAPLDASRWDYRKAIRIAAPGVQQLELDLEVLSRAQRGLADLRLVREGTQVPYLLDRPALSRTLELALTPANDPKRPRVSRWEIKLPHAAVPLAHVTLSSPQVIFQRHVRILERISDRRGFNFEGTLAEAAWSRTPGDARPIVLELGYPPASDTLIIETDNADNVPLALDRATATYPVTRLLFKTEAGPLTLYYGNKQAAAPRYDLALVASQILAADKVVATLEVEESAGAASWARTTLGGARGGIVFWGVLALVVVTLLIVISRLLPKPRAPG